VILRRFPYRQVQTETLREVMARNSIGGGSFSLSPINGKALEAWRTHWVPALPEGEIWSDWRWDIEMRRGALGPRRFDLAIWDYGHLCGLALGRSSARRQNLTVEFVQGSPVDLHPLKGQILPIVIRVGTFYGTALGCQELRFLKPLDGMIPIYERFGFRLARTSLRVQYCTRSLR
jgi:hypothetical protein